ncbi:MAG: DUF2809 domain-containing protein [Ferruginibacter sp.]|nr:DUF2809 domain-containing protein [Ferruginibacter sp.]
MKTNFKFNLRYFLMAIGLFIIEVLIALYMHDRIVRPYIGDLLVVILIYCFVKAFVNTPVFKTAVAVLVFSYAVEVSQYFKLVEVLGLGKSTFARIILGSSFEWVDMLAYTAGILIVLAIEQFLQKRLLQKNNKYQSA